MGCASSRSTRPALSSDNLCPRDEYEEQAPGGITYKSDGGDRMNFGKAPLKVPESRFVGVA